MYTVPHTKKRRLNAYRKRTTYVIKCAYEGKSSAHFVTAAAPTSPITLLLNMYNYVHVPALQELDCALAYVLDICSVCSDDVYDT